MNYRLCLAILLIMLALSASLSAVVAQELSPQGKTAVLAVAWTSFAGAVGLPQSAATAGSNHVPMDGSRLNVPSGYLYVLRDVHDGENQIYGFRVSEGTGELAALSGFPVGTGGNGSGLFVAEQMAYDAANGRLYVINDGSNTISAYSIRISTGTLTPLPFSPIALPDVSYGDWHCLALHPGGSPLVAGGELGILASFAITASHATPASGSPYSVGPARPYSCVFSRNGAYVYTGGNYWTTLAGLSVNASTGVLTSLPGSPFNLGSAGLWLNSYVTDSAGRLFTSSAYDGRLRAFTTSGGAPTAVSGSPFTSSLTVGVHGVLHPAGFYLVADRSGNQVGVHRILGSGSATTLVPVSGSPFAAGGTETHILALTRNGGFVFAANATSRNITTFAMDTDTGFLISQSTQVADTLGTSGRLTGMAYAAIASPLYLPLIGRT